MPGNEDEAAEPLDGYLERMTKTEPSYVLHPAPQAASEPCSKSARTNDPVWSINTEGQTGNC
jgi:hypothetical protein